MNRFTAAVAGFVAVVCAISSGHAQPAPLIVIQGPTERAALAARVLGECAAVGLRTNAVVEPANGRLPNASPDAIMLARGAVGLVILPMTGNSIPVWWRTARGKLVDHVVRGHAGDDTRALAIRIAERLRAELMPVRPRATSAPFPMPEPVANEPAPKPASKPAPGPGTVAKPDAIAKKAKPSDLGLAFHVGYMANMGVDQGDPSANVRLGVTWQRWRSVELHATAVIPGSGTGETFYYADGRYVAVEWGLLSAGLSWSPVALDKTIRPTIGTGLAVFGLAAYASTYGPVLHGDGATTLIAVPYVHTAVSLRLVGWLRLRGDVFMGIPTQTSVVPAGNRVQPILSDFLFMPTLALELAL